MFQTIADLEEAFRGQGYIGEEEIITTVFLSLKLGKPLLIEGAPGVGKTEIAKVLSSILGAELLRLQCYEGLDENKALYEWNYQRQLLKIQIAKDSQCGDTMEADLFSDDYLLERPLLKAIRAHEAVVLLIDEIDKTDEEFEAFLFEILSDFQVSIPEMGTIKARHIPVVVLTSNAERELSDGLKRRCAYLYINYPTVDKELKILQHKVPEAPKLLAEQVAKAMAYLRKELDMKKKPSIAETIDWCKALMVMGIDSLTPEAIDSTLSLIMKNKEDMDLYKAILGSKAFAKLVTQSR